MALTRDFKITVKERAEKDPAFIHAILDEAVGLFLSNEPHTARLLLRDVVNATCGFEKLARLTDTPVKSLHRMLSQHGNPGMDKLSEIFATLQGELQLTANVHFAARQNKRRSVAAKAARTSAKLSARR